MTEKTGTEMRINGFEGIAETGSESFSLHTDAEIADWLQERKKNQHVQIRIISLEECEPWYYDPEEGRIRNRNDTFFSISGMEAKYPEAGSVFQPIILQREIGYLGILCRKIQGVWHFLMQAKIEPGNINCVQISPTIQATKSNFTRKHGGKEPPYLSLFREMRSEDILVDQIQSEQSSRFWGKRNRNVIIKTEKDVQELPSHRWMTFRQLQSYMRVDNLVNMDTRTVFSCIPYVFIADSMHGYKEAFIRSMMSIRHSDITDIFLKINNYKMFQTPQIRLVPLLSLRDWKFQDLRFRSSKPWPFEILFCDLNIEGREVTRWHQPLFAARGMATFGLICRVVEGRYEVLVQIKPEIGCYDTVELGPSVQEESGFEAGRDSVATAFFAALEKRKNILTDVIMSEEGGRFYHEQNRNVIIRMDPKEVMYDPEKYIWVTLGSLNGLTQVNNGLNIQLRNLLMLFSMMTGQEKGEEERNDPD